MKYLLRLLLIVLCDLVYSVAVDLFSVFYRISATNIFKSTDTMQALENIYNNVYTLISLIMLFAFAIKLIQAIVNPDLLSDQKKGVGSIFKRAIIGMGLIVATPFLFKILYDIQGSILRNNTIQKLIIGQTIDVSGLEDEKGCRSNDPGQMLAGATIYAFLYPTDQNATTISVTEGSAATSAREYTNIITCNVKKLDDFTDAINDKQNGKWSFHFDGLCALGMGILLIYYFIIFCMDAALRLVKLIFLQLIAPVIISAYILTNDDTLNKYLKEVGSTFAQVFVRIASISFLIFIIANINSSTLAKISDLNDWTVIKNVPKVFNPRSSVWFDMFIIIGALQFVKIAPDLIGKLLGVSIQNKGGIKGRLGDMAVVGGLAQKAWSGIQGVAGAAALAPLAGLAYGKTKAIGWAGKQVGKGINRLFDGKTEGFGHRVAGRLSEGASILKGAATSGSATKGLSGAIKGLKDNNYHKEKVYQSKNRKHDKRADKYGIDGLTGKRKTKFNEDGSIYNETPADILKDKKQLKRDIHGNVNINSEEAGVIDNLVSAKENKSKIDSASSSFDSIISVLENRRNQLSYEGDKDGVKDLTDLISAFKKNITNSELLSNEKLTNLGFADSDMDFVNKKLLNIKNLLNDSELSGSLDGIKLTGEASLKAAGTQLDGKVSRYQSDYDDVKSRSKYASKMDEYLSLGEELSRAYVNALKGVPPSMVRTESTQDVIDRLYVNKPNSTERHNEIQNDYDELFNSEEGKKYVDAAERVADERAKKAQEYKDEISSIESKMAEIEENDYNFTSNPEWMNLNIQKETASANLEKIQESPTSTGTTATGEGATPPPAGTGATTEGSSAMVTDNSDIISALNKINESVTNNASTLDESINNASTKISDTTSNSIKAAAKEITERMDTISRKSTNVNKANAAANDDNNDDNYDRA